MAHIQINRRPGAAQLLIDGVDYSNEIYGGEHGYEIVEVGNDEFAEVGLRVTFAVSRLDLDAESDVILTDHVHSVAARVRSMAQGVA